MAPPPRACEALPDEVMEDIFARMPAKAVVRCRCLSRAWAAVLSSIRFVDTHLHLANRPGFGSRGIFFLPDRFKAVTRQCRGLLILDGPGPDPVAGRCAFHYVCNPSTGQMTLLPKEQETGASIFGLGYDATIQKHKVVRIDYCPGRRLIVMCEVYVLNNSTGHWRLAAGGIRTRPPFYSTQRPTGLAVFAQGHVHWAVDRLIFPQKISIVSFSVRDEVFGSVPPPAVVRMAGLPAKQDCRMTELGGRLCLVHDTSGCRRESYDIWLLRDHLSGTWDLHRRIDLGHAASPAVVRQIICSSSWMPTIVYDGRHILLTPEPVGVRADSRDAHRFFAYSPDTGEAMELLAGGGGMVTVTDDLDVAAPTIVPAVPLFLESLDSAGRPHEGIIFSSASSQALALALRRLPARTLVQLQCVCRGWRAMIRTDRFVKLRNEYATDEL